MTQVLWTNKDNLPEYQKTGKIHVYLRDVSPEEVIEFDLHPTGAQARKLVNTDGYPFCILSGSTEQIKGWALMRGLEVMPYQ